MTKEEVFELLQPQGCVAVYVTGSSANPYITNPRDSEYIAIFDTKEHAKNAEQVYNVHYYHLGGKPVRFFIWGYLFHFINNSDKYVGQKYEFAEPTLEELLLYANGIIASKRPKDSKEKWFYHVAMVKAIEKYGYDGIPQDVAKQINDLHDFNITFAELDFLL